MPAHKTITHKTMIYTQRGCPACHRETTSLAQKGVEFEEKNVREDLRRDAGDGSLGLAGYPNDCHR